MVDTRRIRLKNRYGDIVELVELDKDQYKWRLYVANSKFVRFGTNNDGIAFVDPSGGPFITEGAVYYVKGLAFVVDRITSQGEDTLLYLSEINVPKVENFREYVQEYISLNSMKDKDTVFLTRFAEKPSELNVSIPWMQELLGKQLYSAYKAGIPVAAIGGEVYEEKCEGF